MSTSEAAAEQEMRRAFEVFDADKSGTITEEELTDFLIEKFMGVRRQLEDDKGTDF